MSSDDKIVLQVKQLIAKAVSLLELDDPTFVEEARTCASLACKLIAEHELHVVRSTTVPRPVTGAVPKKPSRQKAATQRIIVMCFTVCPVCDKPIKIGSDAIMRGVTVMHPHCAEE